MTSRTFRRRPSRAGSTNCSTAASCAKRARALTTTTCSPITSSRTRSTPRSIPPSGRSVTRASPAFSKRIMPPAEARRARSRGTTSVAATPNVPRTGISRRRANPPPCTRTATRSSSRRARSQPSPPRTRGAHCSTFARRRSVSAPSATRSAKISMRSRNSPSSPGSRAEMHATRSTSSCAACCSRARSASRRRRGATSTRCRPSRPSSTTKSARKRSCSGATHAGLRSRHSEGLEPARTALAIYERLGDLRGQLECLYLLVDFTTNAGDLEASRDVLAEMSHRAASVGDRAVEARALTSRGERRSLAARLSRMLRPLDACARHPPRDGRSRSGGGRSRTSLGNGGAARRFRHGTPRMRRDARALRIDGPETRPSASPTRIARRSCCGSASSTKRSFRSSDRTRCSKRRANSARPSRIE